MSSFKNDFRADAGRNNFYRAQTRKLKFNYYAGNAIFINIECLVNSSFKVWVTSKRGLGLRSTQKARLPICLDDGIRY